MLLDKTLKAALAGVWLCAVAAGLAVLYDYENTPGPSAGAAQDWPAASRIPRDTQKPTLILFAHPWCPCTRATVSELEALMAQGGGRVTAVVLFARPAGSSGSWERTGLWRAAAAIPGVRVQADQDDREAALFGARTSGHALLYDPRGHLLFSGGISAARGHEGESAGRRSILALLGGDAAAPAQTPVFGCELHDPAAARLRAEPAWKKGETP
jgi:hypothetical protein